MCIRGRPARGSGAGEVAADADQGDGGLAAEAGAHVALVGRKQVPVNIQYQQGEAETPMLNYRRLRPMLVGPQL